ncbi:MAG: hypothetical protein AAFV53_06225 [Myxococcota bacterium]
MSSLLLALTLMFSAANAAYPPLKAATPTVVVDDITPQGWGLMQVAGAPITGTFTPTAADIAGMTDAALMKHLAGRTGREARLLKRLQTGADPYRRSGGRYVRQVIGVEAGGARYIFANYVYVTAEEDRSWTDTPVIVRDGGSDFFEFFYQPSTQTIHDLRVHGEA